MQSDAETASVVGAGMYRGAGQSGFYVARQKGSHITLRRDNPYGRVTVPNHRELKTGMLRAIIRQAGLTVDEFLDLL